MKLFIRAVDFYFYEVKSEVSAEIYGEGCGLGLNAGNIFVYSH